MYVKSNRAQNIFSLKTTEKKYLLNLRSRDPALTFLKNRKKMTFFFPS